MKTYLILTKVMLSFIICDEQVDTTLASTDGGYLESDGTTVWYIKHGIRFESITTANIIDVALEQGWIKEVAHAPSA